jgi:hypothetical protein
MRLVVLARRQGSDSRRGHMRDSAVCLGQRTGSHRQSEDLDVGSWTLAETAGLGDRRLVVTWSLLIALSLFKV